MSTSLDNIMGSMDRSQAEAMKVFDKLFGATQPGAIFGPPVVSGNYTIITASEVMSGGGFGFGSGIGPASTGAQGKETSQATDGAGGGAGGGGGGSSGRPVAVIVVGPDGVEVKPIIDATKLAIAGITTWVGMLAIMRQMVGMRKRR